MSVKKIHDNQPKDFKFSEENLKKVEQILRRYPEKNKKSAVMPLLDLAQRQHENWIPMKAIELIANKLDMAEIRVLEVATFYTMFNLKPVGQFFLQACTTTPCWLRGSDDMMRAIKDRYNISSGETSTCGRFSLLEVECLGACVNAPILQVNDDFYEDLDYQTTSDLLESLEAGAPLPVGSALGRSGSEATEGATTLSSIKSKKAAASAAKKRSSANAK